MDPLPIIALVFISTLFGFAWHNQPARSPSSVDNEESAAKQTDPVDWGMVVVWSLVFLSIAALLLACGIAWTKYSGSERTSQDCGKGSLASQTVQSHFPGQP